MKKSTIKALKRYFRKPDYLDRLVLSGEMPPMKEPNFTPQTVLVKNPVWPSVDELFYVGKLKGKRK